MALPVSRLFVDRLATIALALLQYRNGKVRGEIVFEAQDLLGLPERTMRSYRGQCIAYMPQSPSSSLDAALQIRTLIREAWLAHRSGSPLIESTLALLGEVSLPATEEFLNLAMPAAKHRVRPTAAHWSRNAALAAAHHPDEPTSALDLITQHEILQLFRRIRDTSGTGILFISHDLVSMRRLCDRIAVMRQGELVEIRPASRIFSQPRHPYTQRLIGALPQIPTLDTIWRRNCPDSDSTISN